jgi:hypothetical protein
MVSSFGLNGDALAVNERFGANYGGTVKATLGGSGRLILTSWPAATRRSTSPLDYTRVGIRNINRL